MSDAVKVLDEIERESAELVALTHLLALAEYDASPWCEADAKRFDELVRKAPDHLALLAGLVRSVAEAPCTHDTTGFVVLTCHPCCVRRELEAAR